MAALYTATATAKGGRDGHVKSTDGIIDLDLHTPGAMGGPGGASNPEQLFAAGWAACFNGALNLMARKQRVEVEKISVEVSVSIGKDEVDEGFVLSAVIVATIPGVSQEQADELAHQAHGFCPYSKATSGNIEVSIKAKTE